MYAQHYNGTIYEQILGLPMRSPLSPLLEDVYMNKIEENFKMSPLQPAVLMRYLDDYFTFWSHGREKLEDFLKFINQIDEQIKFKMEVEEGERLPFLDVEVIRFNETLKKKLFRKKFCAGMIRNCQSHHNYRQRLPKRSYTKKHTGCEKPMTERGLRKNVKDREGFIKVDMSTFFRTNANTTANTKEMVHPGVHEGKKQHSSQVYRHNMKGWTNRIVQEFTAYHAVLVNRNILAQHGEKLAYESRNIKGSAGKCIPKDQN
ncbi:unnamed protein product [Protopolystoma xenopodis]|uniref:Reverse transcriptase domain-containing protein n=1 Tax=Protopolystoma xenopodis TaxID=117903 RepID=A0A3S5A8A3_9PLAT|nr:unnamed protein product [Protopolystoma xenopodis]